MPPLNLPLDGPPAGALPDRSRDFSSLNGTWPLRDVPYLDDALSRAGAPDATRRMEGAFREIDAQLKGAGVQREHHGLKGLPEKDLELRLPDSSGSRSVKVTDDDGSSKLEVDSEGILKGWRAEAKEVSGTNHGFINMLSAMHVFLPPPATWFEVEGHDFFPGGVYRLPSPGKLFVKDGGNLTFQATDFDWRTGDPGDASRMDLNGTRLRMSVNLDMNGNALQGTDLGNNRVAYTDGSGNLAGTAGFTFDGTDLSIPRHVDLVDGGAVRLGDGQEATLTYDANDDLIINATGSPSGRMALQVDSSDIIDIGASQVTMNQNLSIAAGDIDLGNDQRLKLGDNEQFDLLRDASGTAFSRITTSDSRLALETSSLVRLDLKDEGAEFHTDDFTLTFGGNGQGELVYDSTAGEVKVGSTDVAVPLVLHHNGTERFAADSNGVGFNGATPQGKPGFTDNDNQNSNYVLPSSFDLQDLGMWVKAILRELEDYGLVTLF